MRNDEAHINDFRYVVRESRAIQKLAEPHSVMIRVLVEPGEDAMNVAQDVTDAILREGLSPYHIVACVGPYPLILEAMGRDS